METNLFVSMISRPDYDMKAFAARVLVDQDFRQACVDGLLRHPHIMVYDHCFYVVEKACRENPVMFYSWWQDFTGLLDHANSYRRDYGLILLAHLTRIDVKDRFSPIFGEYLGLLRDRKFMTAHCCLKNLKEIVKYRPDLVQPVLDELNQLTKESPFSIDQTGLLGFEILEIIEQVRASLPDTDEADRFILESVESSSPKTKKKARELIKQYSLSPKNGINHIVLGKKT